MAKSGMLRQYFTEGASLDKIIKSYNPDIALFSTIFEWNIKSQDVLNNTTVLEWAFKIETYDLSAWQTYKTTFGTAESLLIGVSNNSSLTDAQVDINGKTVYNPTSLNLSVGSNTLTTITSGELTLAHNSNGNLSPAIACHIRIKDLYDENGEASINDGQLNALCAFEGQIGLDAIPRHAVILSAPNFTDEDNPTITFAIPSGATNVKAYIALDGEKQDIALRSVSGGSYTFNFTDSERATLWSILRQGIDSKQVRFYLVSDHNGTTYKVYLTRTLTVINYRPTLSPGVVDANEKTKQLTGNQYKLIRYASTASFDAGAEAHKGATIDAIAVKNGNITKYTNTGVFENVPDNLFTFTVTDSFGRSAQEYYEVSIPSGYFIEYVRLTCNAEVTEMTADGDVRVDVRGKYFNGSFGATNNTLSISYQIAENNGSPVTRNLGVVTPTVNGNDYSYSFTISGLNYLSVYDLTVSATDKVVAEPAKAHTIVASTPIFDWGRQDFNFNVPVTIQGWQVDTVVEEGTGEIGFYEDASGLPQYGGFEWTFRKWSSGLMECWCSLPITTNVSSAWGSLYTSGRLMQTNLLFPREFAEVPVVTATLAAGYAGGILMTTGGSSKPVTTYSAGTLEIARGTSLSNASYTINYNVKGRWK